MEEEEDWDPLEETRAASITRCSGLPPSTGHGTTPTTLLMKHSTGGHHSEEEEEEELGEEEMDSE